jgi:2',3'-cyclic-nucleotide 2'-phosphodiesterase/3'-nucleotidase
VVLTRLATLVKATRDECPNTLLFDNGDFLQGNPLADYCAELPRPSTPHPLVTIMAELGYDVVGLGNHEFNYGLDFLEAALRGAPVPLAEHVVQRDENARARETAVSWLLKEQKANDQAPQLKQNF